MQALRSFLFLCVQLIVTPPYALVMLCTAPLSARRRYMFSTGWTRFFVWLAAALCGVRYQVIGRENLPSPSAGDAAAQSVIAVSKHSSTWETLALNFHFAPASFIAKRELLFLPFFGWAFALASPITINRAAGNQAMAQMVAQGRERVRKGFNFVIFPEGTRIAAGKRGKYKTGAARLAIGLTQADSNVMIIPVAHNAGYCWPKKTFLKTPGLITLSFLPPIDPRGLEVQALASEIERVIEAEVERLGDPRNQPTLGRSV
jgi:1-acyl-sn-glycerol-3-phosphate acyltransferase